MWLMYRVPEEIRRGVRLIGRHLERREGLVLSWGACTGSVRAVGSVTMLWGGYVKEGLVIMREGI